MIIDLSTNTKIYNHLSDEYCKYYSLRNNQNYNSLFPDFVKQETRGSIKSKSRLYCLGTISFENDEDYFLCLMRYS